MGVHGKGTRNRNDYLQENFLSEHQYYATYTTSEHSMRHRSTWYDNIAKKHIYNKVDCILTTYLLSDRLHLFYNK